MIYAIICLAALGAIFGIVLGIADKKFKVEADPRIEEIVNVLPGANCGSCGFPVVPVMPRRLWRETPFKCLYAGKR